MEMCSHCGARPVTRRGDDGAGFCSEACETAYCKIMASAYEVRAAAAETLAVIESMTSEEYAQGGDRIVRARLRKALGFGENEPHGVKDAPIWRARESTTTTDTPPAPCRCGSGQPTGWCNRCEGRPLTPATPPDPWPARWSYMQERCAELLEARRGAEREASTLARALAEVRAERDEYDRQRKLYHADMMGVREERDAAREALKACTVALLARERTPDEQDALTAALRALGETP